MWQTRERKQRELSPLYSVVFLISVRIILYRHRKSEYHLVTKASKIIVLLYASMYKKVSTYNGFHSPRLFDSKKQILFFMPFNLMDSFQQNRSCSSLQDFTARSFITSSGKICPQSSGEFGSWACVLRATVLRLWVA